MGFISWVKGLFYDVWRVFKKFAEKVTKIAMEEGAAYILDIARVAVMEMAQTDLTNPEKFEGAFNKVKSYAEGRGLAVPERIINKVIEDVYIEYREEK